MNFSVAVAPAEPVKGSQTPRYLSLPPGEPDRADDFADRAVQLAELAGLNLDPWQQLTLRSMLRTAPGSDQWAAYESLILVPRQNGKSVTLEAFDLAKLFLSEPGHMIMHTAHLFPTAMESFRHLSGMIRNTPELMDEVWKINGSHGSEGIELKNGSRLRFAARGVNGAGRGFSPDDVIFDEAYRLPIEAEEALLYGISAKRNPQLVYASSTGFPDSEILWALVERGRKGVDASLMMAEWSADPNLDISVEEQFWIAVQQANPALGYRLDERKTAAEYRKALSQKRLEGIGRERLGLWADAPGGTIIDFSQWVTLERDTDLASVSVFSVEVSLDREFATVGVAGVNSEGEPHCGIEYRSRGTGWVVQRCVELNSRSAPAGFVVDSGGPAGSLITDMEQAGLTVFPMNTGDVTKACAWYVDAVRDDSVTHSPNGDLDMAVANAQPRTVGDGAFAFGRRVSTAADVTPLNAVAFATWGHVEHGVTSASAYVI